MRMNVFEMEGFLRGKCVPRDLKVNETNAEYLLRKFDALEAKCAALENKIIPVSAELPPANESVLLFDANGEGWLKDGKKVNLTVITCENYTHQTRYVLPIAPSPNLRTMHAIYLYPSMCYFEATPVSLGRGTDAPFEIYGHPDMAGYDFSFVPQSIEGAKNPPQLGNLCHGRDLRGINDEKIISEGINLEYLIDAYNHLSLGDKFFTSFFEKLIGRGDIRQMIIDGKSAAEIKAGWAKDVEKFKKQRKPYLLYAE